MKINKKDVEYIAKLARLEVSEYEKEMFTEQLSHILNYVKVLEELNTEDISPTFHVFPIKNVFRSDQVKESLSREEVLKNAPGQEKGFFKVPRVIE